MSESTPRYKVTTPAGISAAIRKEVAIITASIGIERFNYTPPDPFIVRELILKNEWSQTHVANMLNVNVSTVRRWTTDEQYKEHTPIPYAHWALLLIMGGFIADAETLAA